MSSACHYKEENADKEELSCPSADMDPRLGYHTHRWSYKGDVSLFFDFTVGYIQISFQEFNSQTGTIINHRLMTCWEI
jgi:hypothetical protein